MWEWRSQRAESRARAKSQSRSSNRGRQCIAASLCTLALATSPGAAHLLRLPPNRPFSGFALLSRQPSRSTAALDPPPRSPLLWVAGLVPHCKGDNYYVALDGVSFALVALVRL